MAIRFGLAALVGLVVTLALFYLMQFLISGGKSALNEDAVGSLVDFVRVKEDQQVETRDRQPKKPPPPDEPPPDVPPQNFNVAIDQTGFSMSGVDLNAGVQIGSGGFGMSDGEYLPIVKVQPVYPRRALSRGMSGWVIVEFTVTPQGTVANPVVIENCGWIKGPRSDGECTDSPNSIFDSAAISAAEKFKYKPKIIDGDPVSTAGVQNKITFELLDE